MPSTSGWASEVTHRPITSRPRELDTPAVRRPWGGYTTLCQTPGLWVKKLFIGQGQRTSLQHHRWRSEVWYVLSGRVEVRLGQRSWCCGPGDTVLVPRYRHHRLIGLSDACVLELACGTVLERDITRDEDDYGRPSPRPLPRRSAAGTSGKSKGTVNTASVPSPGTLRSVKRPPT